MKYRNLTYCFTTKFGKYKNNDYILTFYKLSMTRAKEFGHTISFYGCKYSIDFLKGYYDNCVDISNKKFELVDDLKLYVHETGDIDTITIDGDLILNNLKHCYNVSAILLLLLLINNVVVVLWHF